MGMTAEQINRIKARIKAEMLRRNGKGSSLKKYTPSQANKALTDQGGTSYDFTTVHAGDPITIEHGTKTLNLLVSNVNKNSIFGSKQAKQGSAIPETFDYDKMSLGLSKIEREYFTGETQALVLQRESDGQAFAHVEEETSCNAVCSGLCIGSCIGMCNGCKDTCSATCGMGCESGSMTTTNYNGTGTKQNTIDLFKTGDWQMIKESSQVAKGQNYSLISYESAKAIYSRGTGTVDFEVKNINIDSKSYSGPAAFVLALYGNNYEPVLSETISASIGIGNTLYAATLGKERHQLTVKVSQNYSGGTAQPFTLLAGHKFTLKGTIKVNHPSPGTNHSVVLQLTMAEIQRACKVKTASRVFKAGDVISDGVYNYTVIGINQDTPCNASGSALASSAYGDVLTLQAFGADVGLADGKIHAGHSVKAPWGLKLEQMNPTNTSSGSWRDSAMRKNIIPQVLEKLPASTKACIGYVKKATGVYNGTADGGANIITADKLFLLSSKEVSGGTGAGDGASCTKNEATATVQYQYYAGATLNYDDLKVEGEAWWLRGPRYFVDGNFSAIGDTAIGTDSKNATDGHAVFPAFCIY